MTVLAIFTVLVYQVYVVQGVIRMFENDARNDLVLEISSRTPAEPVVTLTAIP